MVVAYVPTPLNSLTEICKALKVGEARVREWAASGAPIAVEGSGANKRYSAELSALLVWRVQNSREEVEMEEKE